MAVLVGIFSSLAAVIRWHEPWDIELDDDPLLARTAADDLYA